MKIKLPAEFEQIMKCFIASVPFYMSVSLWSISYNFISLPVGQIILVNFSPVTYPITTAASLPLNPSCNNG